MYFRAVWSQNSKFKIQNLRLGDGSYISYYLHKIEKITVKAATWHVQFNWITKISHVFRIPVYYRPTFTKVLLQDSQPRMILNFLTRYKWRRMSSESFSKQNSEIALISDCSFKWVIFYWLQNLRWGIALALAPMGSEELHDLMRLFISMDSRQFVKNLLKQILLFFMNFENCSACKKRIF